MRAGGEHHLGERKIKRLVFGSGVQCFLGSSTRVEWLHQAKAELC